MLMCPLSSMRSVDGLPLCAYRSSHFPSGSRTSARIFPSPLSWSFSCRRLVMAMFQAQDAQMQLASSSGVGDRRLSAEDYQDEEAARGAAAGSQPERAEKRRAVGAGRTKAHDLEAELTLRKLVLKIAQENRFLMSATFWNIEVATDGPLAQAALQSGKQYHQAAVANNSAAWAAPTCTSTTR